MNKHITRLSFLPNPADGETIYSIMCRCAERTGLPHGYIINSLTGQRLRTPVLSALPGYIDIISRSTPVGHIWRDAMKIVDDHTALPYYVYFLPTKERQEWASKLVIGKSSLPILMALGLTMYPTSSGSRHPRYCPQCAVEQIRKFGFSFFRRHHQLPGVFVCAEHKEILSHGCGVCGSYPIKNRGLSMPGRCKCEHLTPLPVISIQTDISQLFWIARESEYVVNSSGTGHSDPSAVLKEAAIQRGFGRGKIIDYCKLAAGIESRFGVDMLQQIGVEVWVNQKPAAWLRRILQASSNDRKKPSILLLLIIGTLFDSVKDFEAWENCEELSSRGASKETDKLKGLKRLIDKNYKVAAISKHFGVAYGTVIREIRKQGLSMPLSNRMKNKLGARLELIQSDLKAGVPKTEIMRNHDCSEELIILIELDQPTLNETHKQSSKLAIRDKHRRTLLEFLEQNPDVGRATIMAQLPTCYDYFSRTDKEWYLQNVPERKKSKQNKQRVSRVNWPQVDKEKAQELEVVVKNIYGSDAKPTWVTKHGLLKQIGLQSRYVADPKKLPLVDDVINRNFESYEKFIIRRITWAVKQYENKVCGLSVNNLRRVADVTAQRLRDRKQLVYDLSIKFGIKLDNRSFFSMS
ncbi:MAG: TniQ family protein [Chlorobium sp.]|nr:TniQ family protein [Chlorobium sp.]